MNSNAPSSPQLHFNADGDVMALSFVWLERILTSLNASNPVPLGGRFPKEKPKLLETLDALLAGRHLDRNSPGNVPFWL